ncbi:FIVAR domain-containing protein [Gracilibacillus salinarum]|uniref:Endo-acting ulvan lyase C-terminal domain-containing protein n=1 Tax=Gracilibacillus salinarum TaxID=2932255 RepID=A0ABY4GTT3_9BACI|nr:FIVAR domain-containing protein [Gracilibacillus salinarum]UOQ87543.1 hypothetical protein MUN87_19220 [Gracilibacillus salinarum]
MAIILLALIVILPQSSISTLAATNEETKVEKNTTDSESVSQHPRVYVKDGDRDKIWEKIEKYDWAEEAYENIRYGKWNNFYDIEYQSVQHYVELHQEDPDWMKSRMAMYWKEGEHYTQTYVKDQNFDYGEGNAPVPTVRMPGMRTWNSYINPPLEDIIPYNETGEMLAIDRDDREAGLVKVPYEETGHMVRYNNRDILETVERASFLYWLTGEEDFAEFASSVIWQWVLGTYYMNPPLDPDQSLGGPGGYEPGGISGYYDYEVIHDDIAKLAAVSYDFLYDYLKENPDPHLKELDMGVTDIFSEVFKRFIDIGLVRGHAEGNWNTNTWNQIMNLILVLENNDYYEDGKGREYYLEYLNKDTEFSGSLDKIMETYNPDTGLWPESPTYALGTISVVLGWAVPLKNVGTDIIDGVPIIEKAANAIFPWMDPRGNIVVLGDGRGGTADLEVLERLLSYYTLTGNDQKANVIANSINEAIDSGVYENRGVVTEWQGSQSNWVGLATYVGDLSDTDTSTEKKEMRTAYSDFHRHITMKNKNDIDNGLMATLYGGRDGAHLNKQGLAMQLYGKGWALGVDSKAYESYWSDDYGYHSGPAGANTVVPGYTHGELEINALEPAPATGEFTNGNQISENYQFSDVTADEKRRLVSIVRTSANTGYYIDIFRSDQQNNDYIYHNLGDKLEVNNTSGDALNMTEVDGFGETTYENYDLFNNHKSVANNQDFNAKWTINGSDSSPDIVMDMWMKGQEGRTIYQVDAPPTTYLSNVSPEGVNSAPETTPTLIVRQTDNNAASAPFVSVFEPYEGENKSIKKISDLSSKDNYAGILVESKALNEELEGRKDYIVSSSDGAEYTPADDMSFSGMYGIASENDKGFKSLYLGTGKMIQKDRYKIESADGESIAAGIDKKDGDLYYSADGNVSITLPYNSEENIDETKVVIYYTDTEGKLVEAESNVNSNDKTVTANLPQGYDQRIFVAESLKSVIEDTRELFEESEVGEKPGQYTQSSKEELGTAISSAQSILEELNNTKPIVMEAIKELKETVANFLVSVNPKLDTTKLQSVIKKAKDLLVNAKVGEEPGQYPESAKDTFETAIKVAEGVLEDNGAIQAEVTAAASKLNKAITDFEAAVITSEDTDQGQTDDKGNNEEQKTDEDSEKEQVSDNGSDKGKDPQDKLPDTATWLFNLILVGTLLIIFGASLALFSYRKKGISK